MLKELVESLKRMAQKAGSSLTKEELDKIAAMEPKQAVVALVQKMLEGRSLGGGGTGKTAVHDSAARKPCCDLWGGPYEETEDGGGIGGVRFSSICSAVDRLAERMRKTTA